MTTEIAILNTAAVALAADSAITLSTPKGSKSLHSGNKLFSISKYEPVAAMTYNNATLNGIPWETLLKLCRSQLADCSCPTVHEYATHLIDFLDGGNKHIPQDLQRAFISQLARQLFRGIRSSAIRRVESYLDEDQATADEALAEHLRQVTDELHGMLSGAESFPTAPTELYENVAESYHDEIEEAYSRAFGHLGVDTDVYEKLKALPPLWFVSDNFSDIFTGIVIAGFGEEEIYPSYVEIQIEGVACDQLKYRIEQYSGVDPLNPAIVRPFAQREMVDTFMTGVNPEYEEMLNRTLRAAFDAYADKLLEHISELDETRKAEIKRAVEGGNQGVVETINESLEDFTHDEYVAPIIDTVEALTKDQLAEMAESLVNLTSLKRRVSEAVETVGGPVDVAVISKGDGLVWIKRKHYFDPALNQQFFANYFRR